LVEKRAECDRRHSAARGLVLLYLSSLNLGATSIVDKLEATIGAVDDMTSGPQERPSR
jgi:hypothetical protein